MTNYDIFAKYYDSLTANVDYYARAAYFNSLIHRFAPKSELLLDLACGTGSLSFALADLGYDVIAVDASAAMLGAAMQKMQQQKILFLQQSMQCLDLYGTVDAVVCALDSINHLPDENALREVLGRLRLFCAPQGVFLFDVNTSYKHREILGESVFLYETDAVYCVWQNHYSKKDDSVDVVLDFFEEQGNGNLSA